MTTAAPNRLGIPVTVLLECRMIKRSFWSMPSWYLHTVAVGSHLAADSQVQVAAPAGTAEQGELFAWNGHNVMLYKDACERYWHALIGDKPLVYVVCLDQSEVGDDTGESPGSAVSIKPVLVTIDYDEASACAETDQLVLSAPIPGELYRQMEAFVLQHYKPAPFKKRKRRNWSDEPSSRQSGDRRG